MNIYATEKSQHYLAQVTSFIHDKILPVEAELLAENRRLNHHQDWTQWQLLPHIETLKRQAKTLGLWNLFLPDSELGQGLSCVEYAPLAEEMGRSLLAPEIFNCNAPDTGNMEVLYHFGNEQQKAQWLTPLLSGDIRSVFAMTEPDVASSDATNMQATIIEDGDDVIINGRKWWSTGLGHPNCQIMIFMGLSDPDAPKHQRHSMVLVPINTPGVTITRMLSAYGDFDAPYGHGEMELVNVRVPKSHVIMGLGKGFEIAQGRLGPGRIHHCMRAIGAAERALSLAIERGQSRVAFGQPIIKLGGNLERIAQARMAIDQARLLTLNAAWKIDNLGVKHAMTDISAIKVVVPSVLSQVVDMAIQIYGGAGMNHDTPLAGFAAMARSLRLADGPDEVHMAMVSRLELAKYK
ncbi:acyl-CoA dehydrogenase family protein [Shewanella inventionis]|uniref:Acyl-CoA dehydrogenase n=1 Tax=Shewanella inventionis TaxID=1738770 RepID=A0ABQ1IQD9_9GAMM|nr:acyl-CoA dehydrogenase family protein [Shewanella inventionis]MCL1157200.1 acyl-CoA dehydrogenase family protein [Shewanella inventionis]UAL41942.1 acyl-CoA dehydrogenase family protein [Shewanella inventionis]GGB49077.1 acyl-CoA dehydrogenase [Shewanella inventionis]